MFTDTGNRKIDELVTDVIARSSEMTDDQIWQYAYSRLELLSRREGFREATDTEVRSRVWYRLVDAQVIRDPSKVDYWFYVNWFNIGETEWRDQFKKLVAEVVG